MTTLAGSIALGAGTDFFNAGDHGGTKWTVGADGTPDQVQIPIRASSFTSLIPTIYADSANAPAALIGQFAAITDNTAGTKIGGGYTGAALTNGQVVWLSALPLGGTWNWTVGAAAGAYKGKSGATVVTDPFGATGFSGATAVPILVEQVAAAAATPILLMGPPLPGG